MKTSFFIAKRFFRKDEAGVSAPAIRIAIWSISLGVAVMILSVSIVTGFKTQISEKVTGFGAHIQISRFDLNQSMEPAPIQAGDSLLNQIRQNELVKSTSGFAVKPGIVRSGELIEGLVIKGVDQDFDWSFFDSKLIKGSLPVISDSAISNDILISSTTAARLDIDTGDGLIMYFIQQPVRIRKFNIKGIFNSGLEEMDRLYLMGDIGHVRRLNDWDSTYFSGIEVSLHDFDKLEQAQMMIEDGLPLDLEAVTIKEKQPQIFDWLNLQNTNEAIILTLMLLVAIINMVTALLILILDKTTMIGVLKSMGMDNSSVRNIFLFKAGYLISRGLLWGNIIGLGLSFIQLKTGLFTLDEKSYYLSTIPIQIEIMPILLLNLGTFFVCILVLLLPSMMISRINPVNAIRFS